MDRHPFDLASFLMGLALLAAAGTVAIADATGADVRLRWILPGLLLALGAAGLAGSLRRRQN